MAQVTAMGTIVMVTTVLLIMRVPAATCNYLIVQTRKLYEEETSKNCLQLGVICIFFFIVILYVYFT